MSSAAILSRIIDAIGMDRLFQEFRPHDHDYPLALLAQVIRDLDPNEAAADHDAGLSSAVEPRNDPPAAEDMREVGSGTIRLDRRCPGGHNDDLRLERERIIRRKRAIEVDRNAEPFDLG
jgi:hypothetical protein